MKTKPQRTEATCLLLHTVDKLLLKPYKWLIGRCGRNLFLISLSLYKGSVGERKMECGHTKKFSAHTSCTCTCIIFWNKPDLMPAYPKSCLLWMCSSSKANFGILLEVGGKVVRKWCNISYTACQRF